MNSSHRLGACLLGASVTLMACPLWIASSATVDTQLLLPAFKTTMAFPGELVVYSCGQAPCPKVHEVLNGQFIRAPFPATPQGARELWRLRASGAQDAVECGGTQGLPNVITYGELPDAGLSIPDGGDGGVVETSFRGPLTFTEVTQLQPLLPGEHLGAAFGESHTCAPMPLVSYSVARVEFQVANATSDGDAGR